MGALTELTEPDGARLTFANTPEGLRWRKRDGLGFETKYSYRADRTFSGASADTGGNVTREQDALGQNLDSAYGVYDQVTAVTDRRGTTTTMRYFTLNGPFAVMGRPERVTLSTLSGQTKVVLKDYCWSADGTQATLTEYLEPGDLTRTRVTIHSHEPGSSGLNVSELRVTDAVGQVMETLHDANGQMSERRERHTINGSFQYRTTRYHYDAAARLMATTPQKDRQKPALGGLGETA